MAAPAQPGFTLLGSPVDLSIAIRTAREGRGLTRAALGKRCGVGQRFLWDLERRKPTLKFDKVIAVMNGVRLVGIIVPLEAVREALGLPG
jgi:transcriptional regulator with XRE-family HTH domain